MALFEAHGVTVVYGGVGANIDVDLTIERGSVHGLIGPNGAGKTTFVDAVTGFAPMASGRVLLDGVDLSAARPARRARAGMTRTFQSLELFDDLSVRANLSVAAHRPRWSSLALDLVRPTRRDRALEDHLADVADIVDLAPLLDRVPTDLSLGQRKLVGVARALANRPKLLLLDEPAAGLDGTETAAFGELVRAIAHRGIAVLLIDHDVDLVMRVCDEVTVLGAGIRIANGSPAAVRTDPAVIEAYLGAIGTEGADDV